MKTSTYQYYTPAEDQVIREHWPAVRAIAAMLGRGQLGIRGRGRKIGLDCASGRHKRPFTDAEREAVLNRYAAEGAKPLAIEMGRTRADIVSLAQRLGARFDGLWPWTTADDDQLKILRREGAKAAAIATALRRTVAAVQKRAAFLGLAVPQPNPEGRRSKLVADRVPSESCCENRWARARIKLGEHGWPPDLNPKEIAVLESLRTRGPQTRMVLSRSIGEPQSRPRRKRLMTHGGCSAMARLLARGLVTRCRLYNGRKCTVIYTLTQNALQRHGTFPSVASFNTSILGRTYRWPESRRSINRSLSMEKP